MSPELGAKRMHLLKEIAPHAATVAPSCRSLWLPPMECLELSQSYNI